MLTIKIYMITYKHINKEDQHMKTIIFLICLFSILWVLGKMQESDFNQCVEAGLQSEETCRIYAYK